MMAYFRKKSAEAPSSWHGGLESPYVTDENWAYHRKMAGEIAEKGWSVTLWPPEYGGRGVGPFEQIMISEVVGYTRAAGLDVFANMIGPAIFNFGTETQKRFHLPKIATGEAMWCQGWSEPNAGSDLASLNTRAVRDGDHYVVNGQKIWTSNAHRADWMFLVVRTDPKSKRSNGLSILLVDMKTPGMEIRPIVSMDGESSFNEVFFNDVGVPAENLLGEENKGWEVTTGLMSYERMGMAGGIGYAKRLLDDLVDYCRTSNLLDDPRIATKLSELAVEVEVVRSLCYELGRIVSAGGAATAFAHASALKASTSEMNQRIANAGMEILGVMGQTEGPSEWARLGGDFARLYQTCVSLNIAGGTSEIQRNIVAWTALQLPRL
jgi:alkylation response protein AidB-like acyl-CoA dehydrogenase